MRAKVLASWIRDLTHDLGYQAALIDDDVTGPDGVVMIARSSLLRALSADVSVLHTWYSTTATALTTYNLDTPTITCPTGTTPIRSV